jgi:hypothetical protein
MSRSSDDWQGLVAICRKPETQKIMSSPAPAPLPKRGPVRQLLSSIRGSLSSKRSNITNSEAKRAVEAGAVLELCKVTLWLQQKPCLQLHTAPQAASKRAQQDWHFCLIKLVAIVEATEKHTSSQEQTLKECADQLTMSGQSCSNQDAPAKSCLLPVLYLGQTLKML